MGAIVHNEKQSTLDYLKIDNKAKKAILMFHGYGASMYDLFGLGEAIEGHQEYDWFFPNGHIGLEMNMMMSRAWFNIDMVELEKAMQSGQHRDFSTQYPPEFEMALDKCNQFLNSQIESYDEVVLGGFSQGAMVATHLAGRNLERIKRLVCFSGTLIGQKELESLVSSEHKLFFFQSHGKQDLILGYPQAMSLFELLKLDGHRGEFIGFSGAHEIPMEVIQKCGKFLARN